MPGTIERLSPVIGAILHDINLNKLTTEDAEWVRAAWLEHRVVFFRDQQLTESELLEAASAFGTPAPYPFVPGIEGFPNIVEVIKQPEERLNFGGVWHSDTAYLAEPAMGAMLYGITIPEEGGDTIFTNMSAVWDALSGGMKDFLGPLTAINDADNEAISNTRPGQQKKGLVAEHPVVRTHPETNRKLLYVNRAHTTRFGGMTVAESRPILNYLFNLIEQPEFSCRFHWSEGSVAFWDNRACQHYPLNDYHGSLRRMYRVSLAGDAPK